MRLFPPVALLLCGCSGDPTPVEPADDAWRSALYPPDWTPSFTSPDGHFLHDVSYAGYRYGDPLPDTDGPVVDAVDLGADPTGSADSTAAIQAAIDAVADEGGVVWIPAGLYRVDGLLRITSSGVVVRGAGPTLTELAFTRSDGMTDRAHLTVQGRLDHGPDVLLVDDGESRSHTIRAEDTSTLAVGDDVVLGWVITDAFVAEHGMDDVWTTFNGTWRPFFRRTVTAIAGDIVTLDVPLRYPALIRDGASVRRETGHVREVGVEHLGVSTEASWGAAWSTDRTHAIRFDGVADGWIRNIASFDSPFVDDVRARHLMSGGIAVVRSKRVTVADSDLRRAQNRGGGGNGYLYEISRSSEVLVRDSVGVGGRHNFIQNWDFGTSGCVWLRTASSEGKALVSSSSPFGSIGFSEYHHSLAMANLVDDSVADDGWQAVNRQTFSSGAGHAATQSTFWNLRGAGTLRSLQFGDGYVIGTDGLDVVTDPDAPQLFDANEGTAPEDWVEGLQEATTLVPQSLYEDMRARRLR